jgi:hypothetical protein
MTQSDTVPVQQLTTVEPVTWDKLHLADVMEVGTGMGNVEFQKLHNCQQRMLGRAAGKISNLTFELMPSPGHLVAVAVCMIPQQAGAGAAPSEMKHLASSGACFLHYSPYGSSLSGSPQILPGINMQVKGLTTTLLVGSPPHIYVKCEAKNLDGSAISSATKFYIQIRYDLELNGYDFLKTF